MDGLFDGLSKDDVRALAEHCAQLIEALQVQEARHVEALRECGEALRECETATKEAERQRDHDRERSAHWEKMAVRYMLERDEVLALLRAIPGLGGE